MTYRYHNRWVKTSTFGLALSDVTANAIVIPRIAGIYPYIHTPIAPKSDISFHQACLNRAKWILANYDDIHIMFSGGVDSTLVAAYLCSMKTTQKITLTRSDQSDIDADPKLIEWVKQYAEFEDISVESLQSVTERGGMVITGTHADSILVGEFLDDMGDPEIYTDIWDMTPQEMIAKYTGNTTHWADVQLNKLKPLTDKMPVSMTAANLAWWIDFSCLWDRDELEFMVHLHMQPPGKGYISFFNTPEFEGWSQKDASEKAGVGIDHYKYQYKELIADIIKFEPIWPGKTRFNAMNNELCAATYDIHKVSSISANWEIVWK